MKLGLVAAVVVIVVAVVLVSTRASGPSVVVGDVEDFPTGSITAMTLHVVLTNPVPRLSEAGESKRVDVRVFLVNDPDTGLLALYASDPHLGCRVLLASERPSDLPAFPDNVVFYNPCHYEQYDLRGGRLAGPGPRGLDRFAVSVVDDRVVVDVDAFEYGPTR